MISIKIKDPLFTYYARSVNILGFNLEKLSIENVHAINNDLKRIYYVKYNNNPFYLVINNLKGYFKYSKEKDRKESEFIIEDQSQAKIYDQMWDKIKELINSIDGVNFGFSDYFRDYGVIRFDTDDDLLLDAVINIHSVAIFIRFVYKTCCDRFYPQICLAKCIYKKCWNTTGLIFLKVLTLIEIY